MKKSEVSIRRLTGKEPNWASDIKYWQNWVSENGTFFYLGWPSEISNGV